MVSVARKQRKHLLAAHKEIHGTGEDVISQMPEREIPAQPSNEILFQELSDERLPSPARYQEKFAKLGEAGH